MFEFIEQEFNLWDTKEGKGIEVTAKKVGKGYMAICPKHDDHNPSLSIDEEKELYNCFVCGFSGRLYKKKKIVATYDHVDEEGKFLYQIVRYVPKGFAYRIKDGNDNWKYGAENIKKILYKLPELINADKDKPVLFVEGGKDVDNAIKEGFVATTYFLVKGQWPEEYNKYFTGRIVILIPDNDDTGRQYSFNIGKSITDIVKQVKWLELPGLVAKEDISDWFEKGGSAEELNKLIEGAPDFNDIADKLNVVSEREQESIDKKFNARVYSEKLFKTYNLKSDESTRLWMYDKESGIWKDNAENHLKLVLRKEYLIKEHLRNQCVNEIITDIKQYTYAGEMFKEPPAHLIPFKDKIYDLKSGKLVDYNPDLFFMSKLPVPIESKNKECPLIDSMFEDFVGKDKKAALYELAAYCMYRDYPLQKFFIIIGEGSNGKSTFTYILERLLGEENIAAIDIKDITNNRFSASQLFKKLLNISTEVDEYVIKKTAKLKKLTGGDFLSGENKFEKAFKFRNYAKILILANRLPETHDKSYAFYRRVMIINFPNVFDSNKKDLRIKEKITEDEIEGLAYKCIQVLKVLANNNFTFSINESPDETAEVYEQTSGTISIFLKEYTFTDLEGEISSGEFFEIFSEYLDNHKFKLWSQIRIKRHMEKLGFIKTVKPIKNENGFYTTQRVWKGLKWKR